VSNSLKDRSSEQSNTFTVGIARLSRRTRCSLLPGLADCQGKQSGSGKDQLNAMPDALKAARVAQDSRNFIMTSPEQQTEMSRLREAIQLHEDRLQELRDFHLAAGNAPNGPEGSLWRHAFRTFKDADSAAIWLLSRNPYLNGQTPIATARSDGKAVTDLLGRIEYGVYS
jgi:hypothetical protein